MMPIFATVSDDTPKTSIWETYENDTLGITLKIPNTWNSTSFGKDNGTGVNFTFSDNDNNNNASLFFIVNASNNDDEKTLDQIINSTIENIQNITRQNATTISGSLAHEVVSITEGIDKRQLKLTDIITINNNKIYHFIFGADAENQSAFSIFENITESIKFTNNTNTNNTDVQNPLSSFSTLFSNVNSTENVETTANDNFDNNQANGLPEQHPQINDMHSLFPPVPLQQNQPLNQIPPTQTPIPPSTPSPVQPSTQTPIPPPTPPQSIPFTPQPSTPANPALPTQPTQPIKNPPRILSYNTYHDSYGNFHIVGEVINENSVELQSVEVIATFYDTYNRVIGTESDNIDTDSLQPGQRAAFDILITTSSIPLHLATSFNLTVDVLDTQ